MGCELCSKDNRDKCDFTFVRGDGRTVLFKKNITQNNNDKKVLYSFFEEKMNETDYFPLNNLDIITLETNGEKYE